MRNLLCGIIIVGMVSAFSPMVFASADEQQTTGGAIEVREEDDESSSPEAEQTTDAAIEAQDDNETDAGITPESPLYFFDRLFEGIKLSLTFSDEGKAELMVEIANERLAEAGILKDENKQELLEKVIDSYIEVVGQANEKIDEAVADGKDVSAVLDMIQMTADSGEDLVIMVSEFIPQDKVELLQAKLDNELKKTAAFMVISDINNNVKDAFDEVKDARKALIGLDRDSDEYAQACEKMQAKEEQYNSIKSVREEIMENKDKLMEFFWEMDPDIDGNPEDNWMDKKQEQIMDKAQQGTGVWEKTTEKRTQVEEKVREHNEGAAEKIRQNTQEQLERKTDNLERLENKKREQIERKYLKNEVNESDEEELEDMDQDAEQDQIKDQEDEDWGFLDEVGYANENGRESKEGTSDDKGISGKSTNNKKGNNK